MTRTGLIKRIAIVAVVLLGALNYVAYIRLGFAGPIPDLNPLGASVEDILSFRDALGFEGREIFNGTYRVLDFGFICTLVVLLCLISQALKPKRFWWSVGLLAMIFAAADLAENFFLAKIVNEMPQDFDASRAGYVNIATRIKFAALLLAGAAWITVWRQKEDKA